MTAIMVSTNRVQPIPKRRDHYGKDIRHMSYKYCDVNRTPNCVRTISTVVTIMVRTLDKRRSNSVTY